MTGTSMLSCATSSTNGPATETGGGAVPALRPLNRRKTRMASQAVRLLPSISALVQRGIQLGPEQVRPGPLDGRHQKTHVTHAVLGTVDRAGDGQDLVDLDVAHVRHFR